MKLKKAIEASKQVCSKIGKKALAILDAVMPYVLGIAVLVLIVTCGLAYKEYKKIEVLKNTVKVLGGRGGGSGVIIEHGPAGSKVLTNNHVCEVVARGGKIELTNGNQHLVTSYAQSALHDLCILTVQSDLGTSATIAKQAPAKFSNIKISGHPSLLPAVITYGHVSGTELIDVFMGVKPCSEEQVREDVSCLFFGGIPIVKTFESVLVTALIMPGSSGSAVYNDDNEVVGLAFARQQGLGYAYTVPTAYMLNFLQNEPKNFKIINYQSDAGGPEMQTKPEYKQRIKNKCSQAQDPELIKICSKLINSK